MSYGCDRSTAYATDDKSHGPAASAPAEVSKLLRRGDEVVIDAGRNGRQVLLLLSGCGKCKTGSNGPGAELSGATDSYVL